MASSVSKPLLLGIAYLAHRVHGATASVYPGRPERDGTIDGRDVHISQDWILSFDLPGDRAHTQSRHIEAAVHGVIVAAVYLPNGNPQPGPKFDYKLRWMQRLADHARGLVGHPHPVAILGDLNAYALAMNEVRKPLGMTLHDVIGRHDQLSSSPAERICASFSAASFAFFSASLAANAWFIFWKLLTWG